MKKELARTMTVALSKFIDENRRGGMCMSSGECEAMEKAFIADDFEKIGDYVEKKLAESEDERIRECIGMALTDVDEQRFKDFGTTLKNCLSWLEKQKEQKPTNGIYWHAIKKGERLPCRAYIWSQDFEKYCDCFEGRLIPNTENVRVGVDTWYLPAMDVRDLPREGVDQKPRDWGDADKEMSHPLYLKGFEAGREVERIYSEPKPAEWSEQDEKMLKSAIWHISNSVTNGKNTDCKCDLTEWLMNRLKSLRPQPKAERTLLDENIIRAAVAFVEQNDHFNCWGGIDKHTVIKALRSIKPYLKPSEEQMSSLKQARDYYMSGRIKYVGRHLSEIAEQLEKLM